MSIVGRAETTGGAMDEHKAMTVDIQVDETEERTEAKATLRIRDNEFAGWGRARRNPDDPDVPAVGEEIAAARALSDLPERLAARRSLGHPDVDRAALVWAEVLFPMHRNPPGSSRLASDSELLRAGYADTLRASPPSV